MSLNVPKDQPGIDSRSLPQTNDPPRTCPPALDERRCHRHERLDQAIAACPHGHPQASFLDFAKAWLPHLSALGLLLRPLVLLVRHPLLDLTACHPEGRYRVGAADATRSLTTSCGGRRSGCADWIPRHGTGPGFPPLDSALGRTRDAFSPLSSGCCCRLSTRLSCRLAAARGGLGLGWAPAPAPVAGWVLGLGRPAHVWHSTGPLPAGEGDVLVIECDGTASPTATAEERANRRGPRQDQPTGCGRPCPRHRGRGRRTARGQQQQRNPADKSQHGRSATVLARDTRKGDGAGRRPGPIPKKVYGTFRSRQVALPWARGHATRRGFPADPTQTIQIILAGAVCLEQPLRTLFPKAIRTLDLRPAQERLWKVGRRWHAEGRPAVAAWVEPLVELLSQGPVEEVLEQWRGRGFTGPGRPAKRPTHGQALQDLEKRQRLRNSGPWREQDRVLASGVGEGAARSVIGERLDKSGRRWRGERAEAVVLLRGIEGNGDWDAFCAWSEDHRRADLREGKVVPIGSQSPTPLPPVSEQAEKARRRRKAKGAA